MTEVWGQKEDDRLAGELAKGNADAFQALYFRYAQPLFGYLWKRTRDRDTAEDLVQDLFTKVWKNHRQVDPSKSIRAYLYQCAYHLAIDHLRRTIRKNEVGEPDANSVGESVDEVAFERRKAIASAIENLPDAQRNAFILSRFEGLKYAEIASVLNISVKTVETHIGRALKKLREGLSEWAGILLIFLSVWR